MLTLGNLLCRVMAVDVRFVMLCLVHNHFTETLHGGGVLDLARLQTQGTVIVRVMADQTFSILVEM